MVFKENLFIQGGFFNWPSPENVSRLPPPKFAWTGPPLISLSVGIMLRSSDQSEHLNFFDQGGGGQSGTLTIF